MAKSVTGFLTEDDVFYSNFPAAELHEAEVKLREVCEVYSLDADRLLQYLTEPPFMKAIRRYLDAKSANQVSVEIGTKLEAGLDHSNPEKSQDNPPSVLEQSPRSDQSVPDMGGGLSTEEVRHQGTVYGPRSRKPHA